MRRIERRLAALEHKLCPPPGADAESQIVASALDRLSAADLEVLHDYVGSTSRGENREMTDIELAVVNELNVFIEEGRQSSAS